MFEVYYVTETALGTDDYFEAAFETEAEAMAYITAECADSDGLLTEDEFYIWEA